MAKDADRRVKAERRTLREVLPLLGWIKAYDRKDLGPDLVGGVVLAAFAVPESLAHAHLAGLRPNVGLYSAIAATFTYAVFGRARLMVTGTSPALALLTAGTIGALAAGDKDSAAVMAGFAALVAGTIGLAAWLLRLGFLSNLMSKSVLTGFAAGAGLFIAATQLPELFGVEAHGGTFFDVVTAFVQRLPELSWVTLVIGVAALIVLVLGQRWLPRLPVALVVLILGIAISALLGLSERGVDVVGSVPPGAPSIALPSGAFGLWRQLLPLGVSLFVLSYAHNISTARTLAEKRREPVHPDQELLADGAGNLASALLGGMAVGASPVRSLANEETARTQLAGAVSGGLILCVALFLTSLFRNLPETVLAAAILHHASRLVDVRALQRLSRLSKREFLIALVTLAGVLFFGLLWGVVIGVVLSVFDMFERVNHPHAAVLGRDPRSGRWDDIEDSPEFQAVEGVLIVRIEVSVFFGNAESVRSRLLAQLRSQERPVKLLVLDLETCPMVDVSGADMLDQLHDALAAEGIAVQVAEAKAGVRRFLHASNPERFTDRARDIAQVLAQSRRPVPG